MQTTTRSTFTVNTSALDPSNPVAVGRTDVVVLDSVRVVDGGLTVVVLDSVRVVDGGLTVVVAGGIVVGDGVPSIDAQKSEGLILYCLKRESSLSEKELSVLHSPMGLQGPPIPTIYCSPAVRTLPSEPQVVRTSGPETSVKIFPTCMTHNNKSNGHTRGNPVKGSYD